MVPVGSSPAQVEKDSERRGWRILKIDARRFPIGTPTLLDDHHGGCRSKGGQDMTIVVAEYPTPFTTTVESIWLFDAGNRLADVCVRKTTDAL